MWRDHPFSQKCKATETAMGVNVGGRKLSLITGHTDCE